MSADDVPSTSRHAPTAVLIGIGALAAAVVVSIRSAPTEARPLIHPCPDGDCTTQTLRDSAFQASAPLSAGGHRAMLAGHLDCADGTHYVLTVEVDQDGVVATGRSQRPCRSHTWTVPVHTTGGAALTNGPAEACAEVSIYSGSSLVGTREWCARHGVTLTTA